MWHTRLVRPWWIMSSADGGCLEQSKTKRTDEVVAIATARDKAENSLFSIWGDGVRKEIFSLRSLYFFFYQTFSLGSSNLLLSLRYADAHSSLLAPSPLPFRNIKFYLPARGKSLIRLIMPRWLPKTGRAKTAQNAGRIKHHGVGNSTRRKAEIHLATEKQKKMVTPLSIREYTVN